MPPRQPWAFELLAHDDDSYMLGDATFKPPPPLTDWRFGSPGHPHPATCATCGAKVDKTFVAAHFRVNKRRRDITATYDGYTLVSARLRDTLLRHGATPEDFRALPADPAYWWLSPQQVLDFSAAKRNNPCPACGEYFDEVVPEPRFLERLAGPLSMGVYRSSLEFGSVPLKGTALVIGVDTAQALRDASLTGLILDPLRRP